MRRKLSEEDFVTNGSSCGDIVATLSSSAKSLFYLKEGYARKKTADMEGKVGFSFTCPHTSAVYNYSLITLQKPGM